MMTAIPLHLTKYWPSNIPEIIKSWGSKKLRSSPNKILPRRIRSSEGPRALKKGETSRDHCACLLQAKGCSLGSVWPSLYSAQCEGINVPEEAGWTGGTKAGSKQGIRCNAKFLYNSKGRKKHSGNHVLRRESQLALWSTAKITATIPQAWGMRQMWWSWYWGGLERGNL